VQEVVKGGYGGCILSKRFMVSKVRFQSTGEGEGAEREGGVGEKEESMRDCV